LLVSFMHYDLGYIDLEQRTLQTIDNPSGTRLSPVSPGRTRDCVVVWAVWSEPVSDCEYPCLAGNSSVCVRMIGPLRSSFLQQDPVAEKRIPTPIDLRLVRF